MRVFYCTFVVVGPEPPRTITPEWRAASVEKMKRQKANPISGISSKQ